MSRRWVRAVVLVMSVLAGIGTILYVTNAAPIVPSSLDADRTEAARVYVVKLHAQWCPVCMVTKGVWSEIEAEYGQRVRLAVFDFTSDRTTDSSRAEANRLGLGNVFEEYLGETGTVLVIDPHSRTVASSIHGSRDFGEYREAIEAALRR